jgi:hypothetical protein
MNSITDYNPFNFMIILIFLYVVLIGFIFIIIYNNTRGNKRELLNALGVSNTCFGKPINAYSNCIPSPTPIPTNI